MDLIIVFGISVMLFFTVLHVIGWQKDKWSLHSPNLRSASLMMACFTVLVILLFGVRIFLKPDVVISYHDTSQDTFTNTIVAADATTVDSKRLLVCDVVFDKSYPLFLSGRVTQTIRYKKPCDSLTVDMKSDIVSIQTYLKEDVHNGKQDTVH